MGGLEGAEELSWRTQYGTSSLLLPGHEVQGDKIFAFYFIFFLFYFDFLLSFLFWDFLPLFTAQSGPKVVSYKLVTS